MIKDLPLGFGMLLAQNPQAMKKFSEMPDAQKSEILAELHKINSKEEMQSFVAKLAQ